jgi:hypothetical protein
MLKKLTTKGVNPQTKEIEERTANLVCSAICNQDCRLYGGSLMMFQGAVVPMY